MVTSVPEKTLEHWASIFLTYRYKSHAGQWWPTFGEDIAIAHLPSRPGKAIQLEMKTANFDPKYPNTHRVQIDLPQLCAYQSSRLGLQPFYVFPTVSWDGSLANFLHSLNIDPTDHAFQRAGVAPLGGYKGDATGWFGNWLNVATTNQVAKAIGHTTCGGGCKGERTLVRYQRRAGRRPKVFWHRALAHGPERMNWRSFWDEIELCGKSNWPQTFLVPRGAVSSALMSHADLLDVMRRMRESKQIDYDGGQMMYMVAVGEGQYQSTPLDTMDDYARSLRQSASGVHIGVAALRP